ncbi:MAG: universal stress protein [Chloroflexi bacterium]|nr:universal stress protein [Chloroflexota bacterium]
MFKKIVVPLDGSTLAEQALPAALELAKAFDGQIFLLHVVTNYLVPPYGIDYQLGETFRDVAIREAHEYLENMRGKLEATFSGTIHVKVIEGLVAENILDYARFQNADVIVMGTHGRSGVGRWVFGSVAERVLRASICPVLLIRAHEDNSEETLTPDREASVT